jgi:hypothetical protein
VYNQHDEHLQLCTVKNEHFTIIKTWGKWKIWYNDCIIQLNYVHNDVTTSIYEILSAFIWVEMYFTHYEWYISGRSGKYNEYILKTISCPFKITIYNNHLKITISTVILDIHINFVIWNIIIYMYIHVSNIVTLLLILRDKLQNSSAWRNIN